MQMRKGEGTEGPHYLFKGGGDGHRGSNEKHFLAAHVHTMFLSGGKVRAVRCVALGDCVALWGVLLHMWKKLPEAFMSCVRSDNLSPVLSLSGTE